MILNDTSLTITFGTVTFYHTKRPIGDPTAAQQFILDPSAITGWLDGPGTRRDTTPRLAVDGDFYEPAYKSGRLITITGTAVAKTPADLQIMRDNLMGQCPDGTYVPLIVATSTAWRRTDVGFEGTPGWIQLNDTSASFKVDLYAPDPRVYGDWQRFTLSQGGNSGSLKYPLKYPINYYRPVTERGSAVKNNGNTRAYPQFRVVGSFTQGFSLTNNREGRVTYSGIVTTAAPVLVDMQKGTATQNGVDKSTLLSVRDWFSVKPGETLEPVFQPLMDGTGYCDIMFRDTWI
jgi:hypothetical protein